MDLTRELEQKADENEDDPRALLEILHDLTTWSDEEIAEVQRKIIDQVSKHLETPFPWPETNAPTGDGTVDPDEWPEIGLLGKLGYKVGKGGKNKYKRRAILRRAFQVEASEWLPVEEQASEWGDAVSEERLEKIANSLSAFARNAKKRDETSLGTAISHWEEDLEYLKERFYGTRHSFDWPSLPEDIGDGDTVGGGHTKHLFGKER